MISILNGTEEGDHYFYRGGEELLKVVLMDDTGVLMPITADVIKLKLYDTEDRRNAPVFTSSAMAITGATAGYATYTLTPTEMNFAANTNGTPYYGFIERNENTGATFEYSRKAHRIFVK
jgi:hypothetical protein